jgi:hypothetical protein
MTRPSQGIEPPPDPVRFTHTIFSLLGETYPGPLRSAGDVLVPVEDDLRAERRMPRHLDRQMPHAGSMMWKEKWLTNAVFFSRVADDTRG